jgi:hypothetical protein
MDEERIRKLAEEVLVELRAPEAPAPREPGGLEARVAALESAVRRLQGGPEASAPARPAHPSLLLLQVAGGGERCVMEPDKPCIHSGACRALGH